MFEDKYFIRGNVTRQEGNITDKTEKRAKNPNHICNSKKNLTFAIETELRLSWERNLKINPAHVNAFGEP